MSEKLNSGGVIAKEADEADDTFAARLAAYDEALAAGHTPANLSFDQTPNELHRRLDRGFAALDALQSLRPAASSRTSGHEAPTHLGRFEIIRELGRGGFGVVFLAHDPELHRDIALKVPHAGALVNDDLRQRFRREALAAAGLDHPNIVQVYEVGDLGPICYIASAYCAGVNLATWLAGHPVVPSADAAAMIATLARAVAHAHARGVLHRDLKPANILLQIADCQLQIDRSATPKITDFGLAKIVDDPEQVTRSGAALGTPAYMAPEQARGRSSTVGPTADVYALGTILYEMLTGRPPFRGESDLDTLQQVAQREPIAPRRLRPKLPRDLDTICLKCLEKEPAKRYATATELANDLERFAEGKPILARPVGVFGQAVRWCRRKPLVASLAAALFGAVVLGIAGVAREYRRANTERDAALVAGARSERLLDRARESLGNMITLGHELVHEPATVAQGVNILEVGRRYYNQLLLDEPHDVPLRKDAVVICRRLAKLYGEQSNPNSDGAWREAALHAEAIIDGPDGGAYRGEYFGLMNDWGEYLYVRGQWNELTAATDKAFAVARADFAERTDDGEAAMHLQNMAILRGICARKNKRWAEAETLMAEALTAARRNADTVGEPRGGLAESNILNQLSSNAISQNRFADALRFAREAVTAARRARAADGGPDTARSMGGALSSLGRALYNNRDFQGAIDAYRESIQTFVSPGRWAIEREGTYFHLAQGTKLIASSFSMMDRPADAIEDLKSFLELPPPPFHLGWSDPNTPDVFECYWRLTELYLNRGDREAARKWHADAVARLAAVPEKTPEHERSAQRLAAIGAKLAGADGK